MDYIVSASGFDASMLVSQFDGTPNASDNCGEVSLVMMGAIYGKPKHTADELKTWRFAARVGVTTYDTDLAAMAQHFYGLTLKTVVPNGERNFSNGLLDLEWQALHAGKPLIWAGWWVDSYGRIYDGTHVYAQGGTIWTAPAIPHWRLVVQQTESDVTCADPSGGVLFTRGWHDHYALSKQVLLIPSTAP